MTLRIVERAAAHADKTALADSSAAYSYAQLLQESQGVARSLLVGAKDLNGERVAFMIAPSFDYVKTLWGIWQAGGVAVPLPLRLPAPELEHILDDAQPAVVVVEEEFLSSIEPLARARGIRLLEAAERKDSVVSLPDITADRRAMILYTSGTTGPPKGVVTTHRNIEAQIRSLVEAWEWASTDRTLLALPLHHLHGILNVLSCALWVGATCEIHPRFDAAWTWKRLASGELSVFMAVPTIYHRLIEVWESASPEDRSLMSEGCKRLRLMVSGSAALPVPTLRQWADITGYTLLERYGMTEIGMALSNPLRGTRHPGHVGFPLPGVEVRIADGNNGDDGVAEHGAPGEIQVRGEPVFLEYWNQPQATQGAFTEDGWFRTGDIAVRSERGFRILGRNSVDILKSGGEKVSALEVENILLGHGSVRECAVVGIPDEEWGQRIVAAIVASDQLAGEGGALRDWCRDQLAPYKIPKDIVFLRELPRNAMGKVRKPDVIAVVERELENRKP